MTQVDLVRFRFKQGRSEAWLKWCEELKRRENEVLETLENEGVISEACFLSKDEENVYYFMEAQNLETAHETARRSLLPIDKEHRVMMESALQTPERMKTLFSFNVSRDYITDRISA